jgi:TonB-linked SusC/RagA family outer membrane protein
MSDSLRATTLLASMLLCAASAAVGQVGAVAGSVTSVTGENVSGAQVYISGTTLGTFTDDEGRYRLTEVPAGEHLLRVSGIGYQGAEQLVTITPGEVATADFVLEISAVALDELVATITGQRRRRELAADISTIEAETVVQDTRANQITQILKGQATGVYVRQSSGTVGTGADVRIRGTGSISKSTQPLYVVDGAIIDGEANATDPLFGWIGIGGQDFTRLNDLNPDEIESIEVIKGPAASALWGARGNAGVIIITTKQAAGSDTRWNARADLGVNRQANGFADPAGGRSFVKGQFPTTGWNPLSMGFTTDTIYTQNLLEEFNPFRSGLYQNYNGNLTGGGGIWNYFGSVQYLNENGTLPNNQQQRFNFRANFGVEPSDRLNLSFSNGYTSSDVSLPDNDNNGDGYIGVAVVGFPWEKPLTGVIDPVTGETVDSCPLAIELSKVTSLPTSAFAGDCPQNSFFRGRTFEDVETLVNQKKVERYTGSGNVTWNPLLQWTNRLTLGYDMVNDRTIQLVPVDPDLPFGSLSLGSLSRSLTTSRNLTLQGTTTYLQPLGSSLDLEFVGGVQWFRQTMEGSFAWGTVFPATGPAINNAVNNFGSDAFEEQKSIGFFAQGQLQWKDRLFVHGAARWDNNSAQGRNLGIQTYPKLGASYVLLEGQGIFNMLKLRTAWGRSGALPGTNDALTILSPGPASFEGDDRLGISPDAPGNPELGPEVGEEWEVGFDLAMLRDRIGLTFTYYDQTTEDAIVTKQVPPSSGFPNQSFTNIGQIDNRGFEVEFDALAIDKKKVSLDLRFIVSQNRNVITELAEPIIYGLGGTSQRHQEGLPFGSYVQQQVVIGEDGEPRVLTCDETPGTWGPGDTPGDKESFCNPMDGSRWLGDPTPRWESSIQTTIQLFKYVQLYALFDFQAGHQGMNNNGDFICGFPFGGGVNGGACLEGMTQDGVETNGDWTKIVAYSPLIGSTAPWIENADWGKWRTAQLRFDMPPGVTRFLKLSGLSIQLIGENLATWTDYDGLDPEINWAGQNEASRAEFFTLPPVRRFIGTVNIYF